MRDPILASKFNCLQLFFCETPTVPVSPEVEFRNRDIKVVRNKKSKFFSHRYLIEFYETNRMSHVPHLYDVVNLLK